MNGWKAQLRPLPVLLRHYNRTGKLGLAQWLSYFGSHPGPLRRVVKEATLARVPVLGPMHPHQRRLEHTVAPAMVIRLTAVVTHMARLSSFADLYNMVDRQAISGFGDLAIYDTCIRIGSYLGMMPSLVYLHSGTRTGAERILQRKLRLAVPALAPTAFPMLARLSPWEMEDFLCIYKQQL